MSDIVARLHNLGFETCHEAAAEIARLKAELHASDDITKAWIDVARDAGRKDRDMEVQELRADNERLRAIEDAAIDAATYFHIGGCGEEDFDPQRMHNLMIKLGAALERKP